jgi:hypothetical protein
MRNIFFTLILISPFFLKAQLDTNYAVNYKQKVTIAANQFYRYFEIEMKEKAGTKREPQYILKYRADANAVTGVQISYDKFSLGLGIKTGASDTKNKGKTDYKDLSLIIGDINWSLENSYRRYKGFYDLNTASYDTSYRKGKPYFQNPNMVNELYKTKFFYFFNHNRFSYKAGYSCTHRQLKSSGTWVIVGNAYYNGLTTDTSFVPILVRNSFGPYHDFNALHIFALGGSGGGSGTLVIGKHFFINLTGVIGFEYQRIDYGHFFGGEDVENKLDLAGDIRGSIGFNGRYWFLYAYSTTDFVLVNNASLDITSKFVSFAISTGIRFRVRTPKFYQKFQQSKLYNKI